MFLVSYVKGWKMMPTLKNGLIICEHTSHFAPRTRHLHNKAKGKNGFFNQTSRKQRYHLLLLLSPLLINNTSLRKEKRQYIHLSTGFHDLENRDFNSCHGKYTYSFTRNQDHMHLNNNSSIQKHSAYREKLTVCTSKFQRENNRIDRSRVEQDLSNMMN